MHTENVCFQIEVSRNSVSSTRPTDELPAWRIRFLLRFVKLCAAFVKIPLRVSAGKLLCLWALFSLLYAYAFFDFEFGSCTCREDFTILSR